MLDLSQECRDALAGSWVLRTRVESWRAGVLLADEVPVVTGTHETDRSLRIPDRVALTVPRLDQGVSWDPAGIVDHPLAPWGQRLRVCVGVDLPYGRTEWLCRGWFLVQDATPSGDAIRVTAANLLALIDEAKLTAPVQPTGTFAEALRQLVEPALTVDTTGAPDDRTVPAGLTWDTDRLAAVCELCDAWPAEATVSPDGVLVVTAPADESAEPATVADLSTATGTAVEAAGAVTRDGAASCVVARGTNADGQPVQGVAEDTSGGPLDIDGPFNPLPVPFFATSQALATVEECVASAQAVLARRRRQAARAMDIQAVPHPALMVGDAVTIDGDADVGVVERLTMPLTPADGAMTATVRAWIGA